MYKNKIVINRKKINKENKKKNNCVNVKQK